MEKTASKAYVIRWSIETGSRRAEGLSSTCASTYESACSLLHDIVSNQSMAFGSEPIYGNGGSARVMLYGRDGSVHRWWIEELDMV